MLLPRQALEILERRYQQKGGEDQFVFTAVTDRKKPLRADLVSHALASNREALGIGKGFTSHAVRHAFTTAAAERGHSIELINRCTAHVIVGGIAAHYHHASLNQPARELWQEWADFLLP